MEGKDEKEEKHMILAQIVGGVCSSIFYFVNLKDKEEGDEQVLLKHPEELLNEGGLGCSVILVSSIYVIGGDSSPPPRGFFDDAENHFIHSGSSVLKHLHGKKWKSFPPMKYDRRFLKAAALGNEIFALGGCRSSTCCVGEVFDPVCQSWDPLPLPQCFVDNPNIDMYRVSSPVIPDHQNNRLLVHFDHPVYSLYAYYPRIHRWICLENDFFRWVSSSVALVDHVLYFHVELSPDYISAYHVPTKSWLKVVWRSWFSQKIVNGRFESLLDLGNGLLCLAGCYRIPRFRDFSKPPKVILEFVKFRVELTSSQQILATPVSVTTHHLEGNLRAEKFFALQ